MNSVLSLDTNTNSNLISNDGKHRSPSPSLVAMNVRDEDGSLPPMRPKPKATIRHARILSACLITYNLRDPSERGAARFERARVLLLHQLEFCMVKIGVEQMSRGPSFSPPSVPPSILNPERAADSGSTQGS